MKGVGQVRGREMSGGGRGEREDGDLLWAHGLKAKLGARHGVDAAGAALNGGLDAQLFVFFGQLLVGASGLGNVVACLGDVVLSADVSEQDGHDDGDHAHGHANGPQVS